MYIIFIEKKREIIALRPKLYTYLIDDGHVHKQANGTKKCVIKGEIKFQDYKDYLENKK